MTRLLAMTYNVRYADGDGGHDIWAFRREGVANLVRFHAPDVVGFQEPLPAQRDDLRESLPEYEFVGRGRRPENQGEGCPIGVRRDRWTVVEEGTFWLSATPRQPSVDWDASYPRIVTWATLEADDADGAGRGRAPRVTVFNTHFAHRSGRARRESARLLRERVSELADDRPAIVVGDLNCRPGSEPHRILTEGMLRDAVTTADVRHGPTTSLTDFRDLIHERRIDHVLVSADVDVEAAATLTDRDDRGRYPSDHLPVVARLRI